MPGTGTRKVAIPPPTDTAPGPDGLPPTAAAADCFAAALESDLDLLIADFLAGEVAAVEEPLDFNFDELLPLLLRSLDDLRSPFSDFEDFLRRCFFSFSLSLVDFDPVEEVTSSPLEARRDDDDFFFLSESSPSPSALDFLRRNILLISNVFMDVLCIINADPLARLLSGWLVALRHDAR